MSINTRTPNTRTPLTMDNLIDTLLHCFQQEDLRYVKVKLFDAEGDLLGESMSLPAVIEASHDEDTGMDLFSEEAGGAVWCDIPFTFQSESEQEYTYSWYVG